MANAYSQLATFNPPVSANNLQLDMMVLSNMQQNYDANVARVDAIIEQYGNIPLKRGKDRELLANNINTALTEVNKVSKMALTDANVSRKIGQTMKAALTPYIMEQAQISMQIDSFNNSISKKREKNDGTYSDINYTDALEQAGVKQYMEGSIDQIGSLNYVDYVDVNKALLDPLKSWAKDFGAETYIERSESGIEGISVVKEGKRLSDSSIKQQLEMLYQSNPNLQKQMQINSRQTFKGYSDDEFKSMYESKVGQIEKSVEAQKSEIRLKMGNYSKDSETYKLGESMIEGLDNDLAEYKKPLTTGEFNRSAIEFYNYKNDFFNSVANTYTYDRVEKENYDDTLFNASKKLLDLDIKQQTLDLKKKESLGVDVYGNPVGGTTTIGDITPEKEDTKYRQLTAGYEEEFMQLNAELTQIYGTSYSSKSEADKLKFIQTLDEVTGEISINNSTLSADLIERALKFNKKQREIGEYRTQIENELKPIAVEMYNDIVKGRGNISTQNLSTTLPNTVKILSSGKTFEQLTPENQRVVLAEMALSSANYLAENDEDKEDWVVLYDNYKKYLPKDTPRVVGDSPWEGVKKVFSGLGNAIANEFEGGLSDIFTWPVQGRDAALMNQGKRNYNRVKAAKEAVSGLVELDSWQRSFITPDRDISNLQADEIGGTKSMTARYKERMSAAKSKLSSYKDSINTQRTVSKTVSFNPDSKSDKYGVEVLTNVIRSRGVNPVKGGLFSVTTQGDNYVIDFQHIPQGGKRTDITTSQVSIPISQAPEYMKTILNTDVSNVDLSGFSPTYTIPKTTTEKVNTINNFTKSYGNKMPEEALMNVSMGRGFTSKEEFLQQYGSRIRTQEELDRANQLLNATYSSKVVTLPNGKSVVSLLMNGQDTGVSTEDKISRGGVNNISLYDVAAITTALTEDFIKTKLNGTN